MTRTKIASLVLFLTFCWVHILAFAQGAPVPPYALKAEQLAVVVNDADPSSVEVAEYYRKARNIPEKNMVHIRLMGKPAKIDAMTFRFLRQSIHAQLTPNIQAIVMVWTAPYAVECNSITSAMSFGFDGNLCKRSCAPSRPSPYFNSESITPFTDFGIRPSMLLPTESVKQAQELINRGVRAGSQLQEGSAYYLVTSDKARNSRAVFFPPSGNVPKKKLHIKSMQKEFLEGVADIMIYQIGSPRVPKLETLQFLPGALADHLTSLGGDLLGQNQMSSLRWLEAGATASYGTVSEPCNYWQKFPQPTVLLKHYLAGATALEAYAKSVAWPSQGLLIGEPLATPYHR